MQEPPLGEADGSTLIDLYGQHILNCDKMATEWSIDSFHR